MYTGKVKINRALISVSDKTGVVELASSLQKQGVDILSTGGTANTLKESGLQITEVSDYTGFPEIMDGRVKTLHPKVHGGILGIREQHKQQAKENEIDWIDLVVCNLYPFLEVTRKKETDLETAIENIDIGGPSMIRSGAKNFSHVITIIDPADYDQIIQENVGGGIDFETRKLLSIKAFAHTAQYDGYIYNYLGKKTIDHEKTKYGQYLSLNYEKLTDLRYGENPGQMAALYKKPSVKPNLLNAEVIQGIQLSYNNIVDSDAALNIIREYEEPACVVVKHANPCGVAVGEDIAEVFTRAYNADSLSAFGGIICLNRTCTAKIAEEIVKVFSEILIAPDYDEEALHILSKKKKLRVIAIGYLGKLDDKIEFKSIDGGLLMQEINSNVISKDNLQIVTEKQPSEDHLQTAVFGWKVLKHIKSNSILLAKNKTTVGIGAGQVSRVDSTYIALKKAGEKVDGCVLLSDAFFPFRDSVDLLQGKGITTIVQPGGSIRDQEVIDACNEHGLAMVFTGVRCFKH
jgi:phosphoribosylaminoimidazolecarboxamide formyltransferase / IMP cyclohydrolase